MIEVHPLETPPPGDQGLEQLVSFPALQLFLDRGLFERRIFPAMNIAQSGTRKEEKLLLPPILAKVHTLRRALAGTDPMNAMKMLLERLQKFPSNEAFLKSF